MRRIFALLLLGPLLPACFIGSDAKKCDPVGTPRFGPWSVPYGDQLIVRWEGQVDDVGVACVTVTGPDGQAMDVTATSEIRSVDAAGLNGDDKGAFRIYSTQIAAAVPGVWRWSIAGAVAPIEGSARIVAKDDTLDILLIGDSNGANTRSGEPSDNLPDDSLTYQMLQAELAAGQPDVLIHAGDIAYHVSAPLDSWINFFANFGAVLKNSLFLPAIGNHEYEFEREFEEFFVRWFSAPQTHHVLAVDTGPMRLITINSNSGELTDAAAAHMWDTVERWLATAGDRWKTVIFHHPIYTESDHAPKLDLREKILALDEKHDIQLVLNGHNHVYERFETPELHAFVSGGGGTFLYALDSNPPIAGVTKAAAVQAYHTVRLKVSANEIQVTATDLDGNVIDSAVLDKR